MVKTIDMESFGRLILMPINFKEPKYSEVTLDGQPLKKERVGVGSKTIYKTPQGTEIPSRQICRKYTIGGEEVITPKLEATKEIKSEDVEILTDNSEIYSAVDRKIYFVSTESEKLKKAIFEENKSFKFPFVAGLGFKFYSAILTRWQDKIILCCCRGNINEALGVYKEDLVEFNYEIQPQKEAVKKLLKIKVNY